MRVCARRRCLMRMYTRKFKDRPQAPTCMYSLLPKDVVFSAHQASGVVVASCCSPGKLRYSSGLRFIATNTRVTGGRYKPRLCLSTAEWASLWTLRSQLCTLPCPGIQTPLRSASHTDRLPFEPLFRLGSAAPPTHEPARAADADMVRASLSQTCAPAHDRTRTWGLSSRQS